MGWLSGLKHPSYKRTIVKIQGFESLSHPHYLLGLSLQRALFIRYILRYFVFIDESGESDVKKPDPRFEIFVLCGVIFREDHYNHFNQSMKLLKAKYFNDERIIFHSSEMRRKAGAFEIFRNQNILEEFYKDIGEIFINSKYRIISCVIDIGKYKDKYPKRNTAYCDAFTFICERFIGLIGKNHTDHSLHFCLENRNKHKNKELINIYTKICKYGTDYCSTSSFKVCQKILFFRSKDDCINGIEFADLCAYPIARKHLSPDKRQPTYDLFENKFYKSLFNGQIKGYGLKYFP